MIYEKLTDLFVCAGTKYLSAVDADPGRSNQHEIGGLVRAGFAEFLGRPELGEAHSFECTFVYVIDDDEAEPLICTAAVSWYDTRYQDAGRGAEYRLYYPSNHITASMQAGDFFLIAGKKDGSLLIVIAPPQSNIEYQLSTLFGAANPAGGLSAAKLHENELLLPIRLLLESLGIVLDSTLDDDDMLLAQLLERFPTGFPTTKDFSDHSRAAGQVADPVAEPDNTLLQWMEFEERLFRLFERSFVRERLQKGFGEHGDDVDEFIKVSLSIQNRRKSRVGHAFENHLESLFNAHELRFERGSRLRVTEDGKKPDFLFPGFDEYHDQEFPVDNLRLLGAKTTCKERWRQVPSEGDRILGKHLITLEPGISETHTTQMQAMSLSLVVPKPLHSSYTINQRAWLKSVHELIDDVKMTQAKT